MNESSRELESPPALGNQLQPVRPRGWMKALFLLIIFSSGAIVGTCATLILIRQQVHYRLHHPEEMPSKIASRIQWKLGLSEEKTQQVEAILANRQQAIQQIRREFQPQLERQLDQLEEQVADLLDDPQATTWQTWFQEMRAEWLPVAP